MSMMSVIRKLYCSSSQTMLRVRRGPHMVNGGVVFRVDGCGIYGTKVQLILRDGEGDALLLMHQKGGMVEALSIYKKWKG
ncbi:hypothetical protein ACSQ67_026371 [Phaseolus vulgaris]